MTGIPAGERHEKFGEYLVPDLMDMYQKLLDPEWQTLEMIENTELVMHVKVRQEHVQNALPVFHVTRLNKMIDDVSSRRMDGLAVGFIQALVVYFDEADRIDVMPTTSENGEQVQTHVMRN